MLRIKIGLCVVWTLFAGIFLLTRLPKSSAQAVPNGQTVTDRSSITSFDRAIQQRFLTNPGFGMARMMPIDPQPLESKHLRYFSPQNKEEQNAVTTFQNKGWEVGLYLFGRWTEPDPKKDNKKFKILYRANLPVPITAGLKAEDLPKSKKLAEQVKQAFLDFQKFPDSGPRSFSRGGWNFTASPVRVANQSCLQCHTDHVVTDKFQDNNYAFRKKEVGDVNGVIVYAFRERNR
jgi:hypothetical protein